MSCQHIMIIEDEPDVRETLKELLELEGFQVSTAENGQEGLKHLQENGQPCLILLDLMMPVMSGWEFLETFKSQYQHLFATTPVTVVSAAADVTDVQQRYGCLLLKKPVNLEHLFALAHQYCVNP